MHPVYMRNKSISHNTQTTWILNKQYYHSSDTALTPIENSCSEKQGSPLSADVRFSVVRLAQQGWYGVINLKGATFRNHCAKHQVRSEPELEKRCLRSKTERL